MTPKRARAEQGKSDPIAANQIAAAALLLVPSQLRQPREAGGERHALRVVLTAREGLTGEHTQKVNTLTALLRVNDLGIDARHPPGRSHAYTLR